MDRVKIIAVFACLFFSCTICTARKPDKNSARQHSSITKNVESPPLDSYKNMTEMGYRDNETIAVMDLCNATFPIPFDHLVQLNETGEFPSTATRDSKCHLNCIFTRLKLLDDNGNVDKLVIGKLFGDKEEDPIRIKAFDKCISEKDKTEDPCELTYNKVSCLMKSVLDYFPNGPNRNAKGNKMLSEAGK